MAFYLTDEQWALVAPIVAVPKRLEARGRPRRSDREVLDATLKFISEYGTWRGISRDLAPHQTVFRRFREWEERGVIAKVLETLARDMEERGGMLLRDCFMDNLFAETKGKDPTRFFIQFTDSSLYLDNPPERPWQTNTKFFFEEPKVWRLLQIHPSPWIQERLPADLSDRLRFV